jgi:hypothetical protein
MERNETRPKDFTPQQVRKLAVDLKERINGFMNAAFRNPETTKLVDYNKAQEFLMTLDKSIEELKKF